MHCCTTLVVVAAMAEVARVVVATGVGLGVAMEVATAAATAVEGTGVAAMVAAVMEDTQNVARNRSSRCQMRTAPPPRARR